MDAWKFVNYSSISPVYALSLTTEQWGLEPFPGNLVAIFGYWQDIEDSNDAAEPAWTVPYSCPSSNSSCPYDYGCDDWVDSCYDNVTYISASSNICPEPEPCADSGCIILIEGIGKTTTGPANSSIVGLSYGISFLLVLAITITIIMGCGTSSLSMLHPPPPQPQPRLAREHLRSYMNPPPQREQLYAARAATAANMAREVVRCSDLLRQMYALDLVIWGMENCVTDEIPRREEMKRKANALFAEIRRVVQTWRSKSDVRWSAEERQHIEEICKFVDEHNAKRYEG
jgi:hypothetical protein